MDQASPSPTVSTPRPVPSIIEAPPPTAFQTAGAIIAIVFCIAAAVVGYRIIRGGRGL